MKKIIYTLLMLMACTGVQAADMDFNYQPTGSQLKWWGTGKKEAYDIAIRLNNPDLIGKQILGFEVSFKAPGATDVSMFLSTKLALKRDENNVKVNDANVLTRSVTPANDKISLTLDEPYTITQEGVYVGYSFKLTANSVFSDKNPVAIYEGGNENGFFIRSSVSYPNWIAKSTSLELISAINVKLAGAQDYALAIDNVQRDYTVPNEPSQLTLGIINHGINPITSYDYSYEIAGMNEKGIITLPTALAPDFNKIVTTQIPVPAIAQPGTYYGSLTIDKINGIANSDPGATHEIEVAVASFTPKRRVLMEEYTYFGCGWCPIGWACMEWMNHLYPNDFIGVAWHENNADFLTTLAQMPNVVTGAPSSVLNRTDYVYPSFLDMDGKEGIDKAWNRLMKVPAIVDIDVTANYTDEAHTAIRATADCRFIADEKASDYRVCYMVVENGLSSPDWFQSNYYVGRTEYNQFPLMEQFINGKEQIPELEYNDVMVHTPSTFGLPGSIPAAFKADQVQSNTIEIPTADILNQNGKSLFLEPDEMYIVALVTDGRTGEVLNANRCKVEAPTSVSRIVASDTTPVYYDLQGRTITNPTHGLFIKKAGNKATKVIK